MSYTNTLAERTCRYDMDDVDLNWLTMVNEDREDYGLQPLEETFVEQVIEEFEVQAYVNFQEAIKSEEGLGLEYDEDAICDVCRSPDSHEGNEMVFCDACNICVHQICYGITKIPEGSWICRTCALSIRPACALCPNRGGAMKT
ncbi:Protein Jade-1, partial [Stegodyphus mimosarum]